MFAALLVTATAVMLAVGSTGKAFDYTIDFESVTGLSPSPNYLGGTLVPANAQLSDQLRADFGVRFTSANKPYVGLLDIGVGHAAS